MWANGHRIDAWRKTNSYKLLAKDWANAQKISIFNFDLPHQIARFRYGKKMPDSEAEAIFLTLARTVRSYEQVVEVSFAHYPLGV